MLSRCSHIEGPGPKKATKKAPPEDAGPSLAKEEAQSESGVARLHWNLEKTSLVPGGRSADPPAPVALGASHRDAKPLSAVPLPGVALSGGNEGLGRVLRKDAGGHGLGAGPLARAYLRSDRTAASGVLNRGGSAGTPLPESIADSASDALGAEVSGVRVHTGEFAHEAAKELNANAFTFGQDVYFRSGQYDPHSAAGRDLLHHELAHTVQQRQGMLSQSESALEADADHRRAPVSAGWSRQILASPPRILLQPTSAKCTRVSVTLPHKIVFYGTQGPLTMRVDFKEALPAGDYQIHYDQTKKTLLLEPWEDRSLVLTVSGSIKGTAAQITSYQEKWEAYLNSLMDNVPLTVAGAGGPSKAGAGDPSKQGVGGGHKDKTKTPAPAPAGGGQPGAKKEEPPGATDPNAKGGKKEGDGGGTDPDAKEKTPGGEVKAGDPKGTPGADTSPPPPPDAKAPVVQLTDIKQIDELKNKGAIPAKTADDIKAKLEKQENLTFEQAITLLDAMDKVVQKDPKAQSSESRESWLKWAKFIQENKDKISGKSKTSDKGISIAEMKELLAKYHEFVGIPDKPPATDKDKASEKDKFDPAKRKSWNSLQQWEKDLWTQYAAKYGALAGTSDSSDLHLTASTKFSMALNMSPDYMSAGAHDAAVQLFHDPLFIGGTIAGITLYVAAWLAPEPFFSKAAAATITAALLTVFSVSEIRNLAVAWSRLGDETENATQLPELETAAEHFGKTVGGVSLRVLVMIATILFGKAMPSPKGPVGGGGMGAAPEPVPAGGPPVAAVTAQEGVVIKVLADGSILVLPSAPGQLAMSSSAGGGKGSSGGPSSGQGSGNGPKPKEPEVPEDTHGLRDTPGGKPVAEGKEVGNFVHNKAKNFEKLPTFTSDPNVISEMPPADSIPEYEIESPNYTKGRGPRIDRLDRTGQTVIEIKPKGLYDQGLAEAKAYALEMDKLEPLPNGAKWKAKCITYDYDVVTKFLKKIGYIY